MSISEIFEIGIPNRIINWKQNSNMYLINDCKSDSGIKKPVPERLARTRAERIADEEASSRRAAG